MNADWSTRLPLHHQQVSSAWIKMHMLAIFSGGSGFPRWRLQSQMSIHQSIIWQKFCRKRHKPVADPRGAHPTDQNFLDFHAVFQ